MKKGNQQATNPYVDSKIWDVTGQFAKGKTEEVQAINRRLNLIKTNLNKSLPAKG